MVKKLSVVVLFSLICTSVYCEPAIKKLVGKEIVRKDDDDDPKSTKSAADKEAETEYMNKEIEQQSLVLEEQQLKAKGG